MDPRFILQALLGGNAPQPQPMPAPTLEQNPILQALQAPMQAPLQLPDPRMARYTNGIEPGEINSNSSVRDIVVAHFTKKADPSNRIGSPYFGRGFPKGLDRPFGTGKSRIGSGGSFGPRIRF